MPQNETLLFVLFNLFIIALLALDLGVFHRKAHSVSTREAAIWSVVWVTLSLLFNAGLFWYAGHVTALEFLAGYLIEKALSVDNIFVFLVIFSYFGVPSQFQHKVLFWGVLGALIMRSIFIALGATLIARFDWILYVFGVILIVSGWKMMFQKEVEVHPDKNVFIRLARRFFPVLPGYETPKFIVRRGGRLFITPLLLVLITVETTDVVFAVDSIPAVFGVTRDPFIVYSSNVFAILGLRALYFLLSGMMNSFAYLSYGLSLVLIFIGVKMLAEGFLHIPIVVSLIVVAGILGVSILASVARNRRRAPDIGEQ
ncbi:MAG: TerC family protein [Bacteroidota bacterium]